MRGGGAELAAALHAAVSPPLCEQLANLATLCAAMQPRHGTGGGEGGGGDGDVKAEPGAEGSDGGDLGFGLAAEVGCRCPSREAAGAAGAAGVAVLVGTHHKTGTVLLQQLMMDLIKLHPNGSTHKPGWSSCPLAAVPPPSPPSPPPPPPPFSAAAAWQPAGALPRLLPPAVHVVCFDEHVKSVPAGWRGLPFVHAVRDPLEVCVSSYLYNSAAKEGWLHLPQQALGGASWQQHLRNMSTAGGLHADCSRALKELRQMASLYAATKQRPDTLTLRLEEVEHDFDAVVARLLFFIGAATDAADAPQAALALRLLRLARKHDLRRTPRDVLPAHVKAHVSDAAGKAQLRGLLLEPSFALGGELRALRAQLGYPVAEAGARASVAELSRRWRLMTTSTSPLDPVEHPLGPK